MKDKQIKGVIFDLDGTLLDSSQVWVDVDKEFFRIRGSRLPSDYGEKIGHIGLKAAAIYTKENYFPNESIDEIIGEWKNAVIYRYAHTIKLKPHVKEFLEYLKEHNIPCCAATANDEDCYRSCFINNGINEYFNFVLEVANFRNKEFPDIYLESAKRLGLKPEECLVCEDIALAINTANQAGFTTCAVYDSFCKEEELKKQLADYYIEDFNTLIKEIKL